MALALYRLLATVALLPAALALPFAPAWRRGLAERLGLASPPGERGDGELLWVHAASVGEVRAAEALVRGLLAARPRCRLLVSTFTPSGRRVAEESIGPCGGRVRFTFLPLDWGPIPGRVLRRERPALFVLLETEIWPGLMAALGAAGVPVLVANGRLSPRSAARYARLRRPLAAVLAPVRLALARTGEDAARFRAIGVPGERVRVAGNLKHAPAPGGDAAARREGVRERLGAARGRPVIVAGSLRAGEARLVAGAARRLLAEVPSLLLVVAPRHPARFDAAELAAWPAPPAFWSAAGGRVPDGVSLLVLDTVGELADLYGAAAVAVVGGTWVPRGGHNIVEPALRGAPVVFGPDCSSFADEAGELLAAGGGFVAGDEAALAARLRTLLLDEGARRQAAAAAAAAARRLGGAVELTVAAVAEILDGGAPSRGGG